MQPRYNGLPRHWQNVFVTMGICYIGFFSLNFATTGLTNIARYTGVSALQGFDISGSTITCKWFYCNVSRNSTVSQYWSSQHGWQAPDIGLRRLHDGSKNNSAWFSRPCKPSIKRPSPPLLILLFPCPTEIRISLNCRGLVLHLFVSSWPFAASSQWTVAIVCILMVEIYRLHKN